MEAWKGSLQGAAERPAASAWEEDSVRTRERRLPSHEAGGRGVSRSSEQPGLEHTKGENRLCRGEQACRNIFEGWGCKMFVKAQDTGKALEGRSSQFYEYISRVYTSDQASPRSDVARGWESTLVQHHLAWRARSPSSWLPSCGNPWWRDWGLGPSQGDISYTSTSVQFRYLDVCVALGLCVYLQYLHSKIG